MNKITKSLIVFAILLVTYTFPVGNYAGTIVSDSFNKQSSQNSSIAELKSPILDNNFKYDVKNYSFNSILTNKISKRSPCPWIWSLLQQSIRDANMTCAHYGETSQECLNARDLVSANQNSWDAVKNECSTEDGEGDPCYRYLPEECPWN